jgi:amino acid transporter
MAIRVMYGMARLEQLPRIFGAVNQATSTPLNATAGVMAAALVLALLVALERLAEFTSLATLVVFAMVNLALLKLRLRSSLPARAPFTVPLWVPAFGLLTSVAMIASSVL